MRLSHISAKRILSSAIILMVAAVLFGCGGTKTVKETETAASESATVQDDISFMVNTYGFSEEELQGIDVWQLIHDYELLERQYTPEEIRMILEDQGDMYVEDEATILFRIFSRDGGPLKEGQTDIVRIGFYENAGTLVERSIFDLENKVFYVDGPEPHAMSEAQAEELKQLPGRWNIPAWDVHTEGKEAPSTGNYGWKLVFELSDGAFAVYDGFTGDMTHLPEHFEEVRDTLDSVKES